jgi:S1-C subfamily serine protease
VDVVCTASDFAPGRVQATATAEQAAVVRVPLVRRSPQGGAGFTLDAYLGGARVASVAEGGPAGVAGLRPGDAILAVDGTATSLLGPSGTMALVESHPPGTAVELTLERGKLSVMMGGR